MKVPGIISGQPVDPGKQQRAKELRREMTPAERLLWSRLRRDQLHGLHFRRQQVVRGLIADFYCHAAGVIVEVDGSVHEGREQADAERDRILQGSGFRILRFTNNEVMRSVDEVLRAIAGACGVDPSPRPPPLKGEGGTGRGSRPWGERFHPLAPPPPSGEGAGGRGYPRTRPIRYPDTV